jgi:hypothetical protein
MVPSVIETRSTTSRASTCSGLQVGCDGASGCSGEDVAGVFGPIVDRLISPLRFLMTVRSGLRSVISSISTFLLRSRIRFHAHVKQGE